MLLNSKAPNRLAEQLSGFCWADAWARSSGECRGKSPALSFYSFGHQEEHHLIMLGASKKQKDVISFLFKSLGRITFIIRMLPLTIKLPTSFLPWSNKILASKNNLHTELYGIPPAIIYSCLTIDIRVLLLTIWHFIKQSARIHSVFMLYFFFFLVRNFVKMKNL